MSTVTWIVLLAICGFVWGGFIYSLIRGLRSEARKSKQADIAETQQTNQEARS